jgi:hypothetical protein
VDIWRHYRLANLTPKVLHLSPANTKQLTAAVVRSAATNADAATEARKAVMGFWRPPLFLLDFWHFNAILKAAKRRNKGWLELETRFDALSDEDVKALMIII